MKVLVLAVVMLSVSVPAYAEENRGILKGAGAEHRMQSTYDFHASGRNCRCPMDIIQSHPIVGGTGIVILAIVLDRITQKIVPQDNIKTR